MKKQLIIAVVHMMHGNDEKEGKWNMKTFKNIVAVMALLMVGAVGAKGVAGKQPTTGQQPTTQPSTGVIPQVQPVYLPREQLAARQQPQPQQQSTTMSAAQKEALFNELMSASLPWNAITRNKYDDARAKDLFSVAQEQILNQRYTFGEQEKEIQTLRRQAQMQQQQGLMQLPSSAQKMAQQQQAVEAPWTFEGAAAGAAARAKALGTYGWEQLRRGYGAAQSTLSRLLGSYQSSIGTGTKLALSLGTVAIAPYLGVAAALGATSTGLLIALGGSLGLGTYALTSALDKLEYRYVTGEWSDEKAEEVVKGTLEEILRDSLTYPTIAAKIEALSDMNELYGLKKVTNPIFANIVKKAHDSLKQQYANLLGTLDSEAKDEENQFVKNVNSLRNDLSYDKSNAQVLGSYASSLEAQHDLVQYEAVLSEYRRALKMKNMLKQKAQLAQSAQKPVVQQQPAQPVVK